MKAKVFNTDSQLLMKKLPDDSIDSCVTDPPYELGFMGKKWDNTGIAYSVDFWGEILRVLKPGAYCLAFGGTRTYHRMVCAMEDAGFEIVDSIDWIYGSGFPKALDISKAIDKKLGVSREVIGYSQGRSSHFSQIESESRQVPVPDPVTAAGSPEAARWEGWKTALKPAHEPIVVARKPFKGTFADNVLKYGTGAFNIDATRVGDDIITDRGRSGNLGNDIFKAAKQEPGNERVGRFPTNIVFSHLPECATSKPTGDTEVDVCADGCPVAELDRQSGRGKSTLRRSGVNSGDQDQPKATYGLRRKVDFERGHNDEGGASRFFPAFKYQAKAPTKERPKVDGIAHPTVKPLALMRWLVRLVTQPGGIVLEPFAGSGATIQAALDEGMNCIAGEFEAKHMPLIKQRLEGYNVTYGGTE